MISSSENGEDVNNWTMEELKEVVVKFESMQTGNVGTKLLQRGLGEEPSKDPANTPATASDPSVSASASTGDVPGGTSADPEAASPSDVIVIGCQISF